MTIDPTEYKRDLQYLAAIQAEDIEPIRLTPAGPEYPLTGTVIDAIDYEELSA